jgi:hypothetical protein
MHNLNKHRTGLEFSVLPRTLQDAVMIARFRDFEYIWIDCLCILQDSIEDLGREAARMADIYSIAVLYIAASRAIDYDAGFLHPHKRRPWQHV